MRLLLIFFTILNLIVYSQDPESFPNFQIIDYLPDPSELIKNNIARIESEITTSSFTKSDTTHRVENSTIYYCSSQGLFDSILTVCAENRNEVFHKTILVHDQAGILIEKHNYFHITKSQCSSNSHWVSQEPYEFHYFFTLDYDRYEGLLDSTYRVNYYSYQDSIFSAECKIYYYKDQLLQKDTIYFYNDYPLFFSPVRYYHYNENNLLIEISYGSPEGVSLIFIYDEYGRRIQKKAHYPNRRTKKREMLIREWEYDSSGNVVLDVIHHSNGLEENQIYSYDSNNRLVYMKHSFPEHFIYKIEILYNDLGFPEILTHTSFLDNKTMTVRLAYIAK